MIKDNLIEIFFSAADEYPDNIAICQNDKDITYRQLKTEIIKYAQYLRRKGIVKHSRVMVFIPMSVQLYTTVLALFYIGAIVIFVDEWANRDRLKKALEVVEVDTLILPFKFKWLSYIIPPFNRIKRKIVFPRNLPFGSENMEKMSGDDTALITFTTGSTGLPKAADRTHQFLWEQFRILKDEINAGPEDKVLVTLPIVLLSILGTGATGIVPEYNQKKPHKLNVDLQISTIHKKAVTMLIGSPYYIHKIAKSIRDKSNEIRRIITGGAPVFPEMANIIHEAFPTSENIIAYGSTEAEPISTIKMDAPKLINEGLTNGLCVGKVHKEIELKIIKIKDGPISLSDNTWEDIELENGKIGEIVVSGPHVLERYYNSEESFKRNKIKDGDKIWHRTGDSAQLRNGFLYLHGRCRQLLFKDGKVISPFIVEQVISEIPNIGLGTLLNVNDKIIIVIEKKKNFDFELLKNKLNALSIQFDEVITLDNIPRDPRHFSKIDYGILKSLIQK